MRHCTLYMIRNTYSIDTRSMGRPTSSLPPLNGLVGMGLSIAHYGLGAYPSSPPFLNLETINGICWICIVEQRSWSAKGNASRSGEKEENEISWCINIRQVTLSSWTVCPNKPVMINTCGLVSCLIFSLKSWLVSTQPRNVVLFHVMLSSFLSFFWFHHVSFVRWLAVRVTLNAYSFVVPAHWQYDSSSSSFLSSNCLVLGILFCWVKQ